MLDDVDRKLKTGSTYRLHDVFLSSVDDTNPAMLKTDSGPI